MEVFLHVLGVVVRQFFFDDVHPHLLKLFELFRLGVEFFTRQYLGTMLSEKPKERPLALVNNRIVIIICIDDIILLPRVLERSRSQLHVPLLDLILWMNPYLKHDLLDPRIELGLFRIGIFDYALICLPEVDILSLLGSILYIFVDGVWLKGALYALAHSLWVFSFLGLCSLAIVPVPMMSYRSVPSSQIFLFVEVLYNSRLEAFIPFEELFLLGIDCHQKAGKGHYQFELHL